MKIFVSSLIGGMEPLRAAARAAILSLGHEPVMAENFGAQPQSPQIACLDALRGCDAVVLILGARYGFTQPSGLSATHEEFREARDRIPVLAFAQAGAQHEPAQAAFVKEVREGWVTSLFSFEFTDAEDLRPRSPAPCTTGNSPAQQVPSMRASCCRAPFRPLKTDVGAITGPAPC